MKKEHINHKAVIESSENELLVKVYDRYFGLQAEAERKEFEDMKKRRSERLGQQCTVLHYSLPENTLEEERSAMKKIAGEVRENIMSDDPEKQMSGNILARIYFGNYAKQNHPGNRGRGWCDADLALWLNWVRAGLPGGEWHLFYGKLLKSDEYEN